MTLTVSLSLSLSLSLSVRACVIEIPKIKNYISYNYQYSNNKILKQ